MSDNIMLCVFLLRLFDVKMDEVAIMAVINKGLTSQSKVRVLDIILI